MAPTWVKGTTLLAAAFIAGAVVGVGFERRRAPAPEAAGTNAHHLMHRFQRDLGLDSAQHAAIAAILTRRQGAVDSTWHAVQPHVRATLDSTLREIVDILRPDQAAKLRKMMEAMHPVGTAR